MSKEERKTQVLLRLVATYIEHGRPIGSQSLQEEFPSLSSATIRNYFAELEEEGYLNQLHISGGRIPTSKAYRFFAERSLEDTTYNVHTDSHFSDLNNNPSREIATQLQQAAEYLSDSLSLAVFISSPRFDHDFVRQIHLVVLDTSRCLAILVSDFGVIRTETLSCHLHMTAHLAKRIESFFMWRLHATQIEAPITEPQELALAQSWYNEVMVRYLVGYAHFNEEEVFRTGFSKLLSHQEFKDAEAISKALTLFENRTGMRLILRDCMQHETLKFWIHNDLTPFSGASSECAVITAPYRLNERTAGAVGILGPMRIDYPAIFNVLQDFTATLSQGVTASLYKHKIQFRSPEKGAPLALEAEEQLLLEDRKKKEHVKTYDR